MPRNSFLELILLLVYKWLLLDLRSGPIALQLYSCRAVALYLISTPAHCSFSLHTVAILEDLGCFPRVMLSSIIILLDICVCLLSMFFHVPPDDLGYWWLTLKYSCFCDCKCLIVKCVALCISRSLAQRILTCVSPVISCGTHWCICACGASLSTSYRSMFLILFMFLVCLFRWKHLVTQTSNICVFFRMISMPKGVHQILCVWKRTFFRGGGSVANRSLRASRLWVGRAISRANCQLVSSWLRGSQCKQCLSRFLHL